MRWKFWRSPQREAPEEVVTRVWKFRGRSLELTGPLRDVQVAVGGSEITVEASGLPSRLDCIRPAQRTGGACITYPLSTWSRRIWRLNQMWPQNKWLRPLANMQVWAPHRLPTLKVMVPEGTRIIARGLFGCTQVGDTHGEVEISATFKAATTIGAVARATIRAQSASVITVESVSGRTIIDADFYAKVRVLGGVAPELRIHADCGAEVDFLGEAGVVWVDAGFYSRVQVIRAAHTVQARLDGHARAGIVAGAVRSVVVDADRYTHFSFGGSTQSLATNQGSHASVRVGRVESRLNAALYRNATLFVGNGGDEVCAIVNADSGAQAECNVDVESGRLLAGSGSSIAVRSIRRFVDIPDADGDVHTLRR